MSQNVSLRRPAGLSSRNHVAVLGLVRLQCQDQPAVLLRFQLTATLKPALLERRGTNNADSPQQSIMGDGVDSVSLKK